MVVLPDETVQQVGEQFGEQLSRSFTTEIAAFDKFAQFLSDGEATALSPPPLQMRRRAFGLKKR